MTAAASTAVCVHTRPYYSCHHPDSRSTRVQQAVVLLMYTKKYGRTYAVCISYHGRVYRFGVHPGMYAMLMHEVVCTHKGRSTSEQQY
jgi:hypothetical protein